MNGSVRRMTVLAVAFFALLLVSVRAQDVDVFDYEICEGLTIQPSSLYRVYEGYELVSVMDPGNRDIKAEARITPPLGTNKYTVNCKNTQTGTTVSKQATVIVWGRPVFVVETSHPEILSGGVVCEGTELVFRVKSKTEPVSWTISGRSEAEQTDNFKYTVTESCRINAQSYNRACGAVEQSFVVTVADKPDLSSVRPILDTVISGGGATGCSLRPDVRQVLKGATGGAVVDYTASTLSWQDDPGADVEKTVQSGVNRWGVRLHAVMKINGNKCADVSGTKTYDTNFIVRYDGISITPTVNPNPVSLKPCAVTRVTVISQKNSTLSALTLTADDSDLAGTGAPKEKVPDPNRDIRAWDLTWQNYTGRRKTPVLQIKGDYTQTCPLSKKQPTLTLPFSTSVETCIDTSYLTYTYEYCPDELANLEVIGDLKIIKDASVEFVAPSGISGRMQKVEPPSPNSLLSYKTKVAVSESSASDYTPLTLRTSYRVETGSCAFPVRETKVVRLEQKNCKMGFEVNTAEGCIGNKNEQYYILSNKPDNFIPDSVVFAPNATFALAPGSWNADFSRFSFQAYYPGADKKEREEGNISATLYYHTGAGAPVISKTTEGILKVKTCPPEVRSVTKLTTPVCPGTSVFSQLQFNNSSLDTTRSRVDFIVDATPYINRSKWNITSSARYFDIENYPLVNLNYRIAVTYNQGDSIYRIDSLPLVKWNTANPPAITSSIPSFIEMSSSCSLIKENDGARCCEEDVVEVAIRCGNTYEMLQRIEWDLAPGYALPELISEDTDPNIKGGKILRYKVKARLQGIYPFRAYARLKNRYNQEIGDFMRQDTLRLEVREEPHVWIQDTLYACKGSTIDMSDYIDWDAVASVLTPSSLIYNVTKDDDLYPARAQMSYSCASGMNPLMENIRIIAESPVYLDPKRDTSVCPNSAVRFAVSTNGRVSWFRRVLFSGGGYSDQDTLCLNEPFYSDKAKPIDQVDKDTVLYTVISQSVCPGSKMQIAFRATPHKLPTLQIADNSVCGSEPVRLEVNYDKTAIDSVNDVAWWVNGQRPSSALIDVRPGSSINVECSVRDKNTGCENRDAIVLYAWTLPEVRITPKTTGNTLCVRKNEQHTFNVSGADSYTWSIQGTPSRSGSSFSWQGDQDAVLYVMGVESVHQCSAMDSVKITLYASHPQTGDTIACYGDTLQYSVNLEAGVGYQWFLPDGKPLDCQCSYIQFAPYEPADTGIYTLRFTRGECSDDMKVKFSMYAVPELGFVQDGLFCEGESLLLDAVTDLNQTEINRSVFSWYDEQGNELLSGQGRTSLEGAVLSTADSGAVIVLQLRVNTCTYRNALSIKVDAHTHPAFDLADFYCEGDQLELKAEDQGTGAIYRWYMGSGILPESTSPVSVVPALQMADNADISLVIMRGACSDTLTKRLEVRSLPIPDIYVEGGLMEAGNMYFCEGMPVSLRSRGLMASDTMAWYFGNTLLPGSESGSYRIESASLTDAGRYAFVVKRNGCNGDSSVNVDVRVMPQIVLADTFLCSGYPLVLDASDSRYPGALFAWAELGVDSARATVTVGGNYRLRLNYRGCQTEKVIAVDERPSPHIGFPSDTAMCQRDSVLLEGPEGMAVYRWQDGHAGASYLVKEEGPYSLFVENGGCTDFAEIYVKEEFCSNLYLPTAFTPDGDGINDEFGPLTTAEPDQLVYWFRIFDKNGEVVFSSDKLHEKWDGTFKGKPCPPGIYLYRCVAKVRDGSRDLSTSGRVTLIR